MPLGEYLINRLHTFGVRHAFGVPGDYILELFKQFEQSPIEIVGATNELCAGYAADAYARLNGLGIALVTYAVGGFSISNAVACAYAERSPLVVISGAFGLQERKRARKRGEILHHTVAHYKTQDEVFAQLTCAHAVLDDPLTAFREIDRVLAECLRQKRPVYLEIPRDRVNMLPAHAHVPTFKEPQSDRETLAEAVAETVAMLRASKKPAIVAGVEVARFRLQRELLRLAENSRIPMVAMGLSKSVVSERHPLYVGIYQAALGLPEVIRFVEDSDCLLMLGGFLNDFDTGLFSHNLDDDRIILAAGDQVRIRRHHFPDIRLDDFLRAMVAAELRPFDRLPPQLGPVYPEGWRPEPGKAVTVQRLFQKINACLNGQMVVLADPGQTILAATDLTLPPDAEFLSPAFYASMGWALPAAIGAQVARSERRPLVLVGDGAFQMTGTELGTARRRGLNPVVVVLNNQGYLSERFMMEGKFNDIPDWNYHRLPDYLGAGRGFDVRTEDELEAALTAALADRSTFSVLNVHVDRDDQSPALQRLAGLLAKRR